MNETHPSVIQVDESVLLGALALAIRDVGLLRFRAARLVEPSNSFFPERRTPDVAGVEGVLRALFQHAGLGAIGFVVSTSREELGETNEEPAETEHPESCVWLSAVRESGWLFGTDLRQLSDVVGAASHEIAHGYRLARRRTVRTRSAYRTSPRDGAPSRLDDWTLDEVRAQAIETALGFGLLAVNHSLAADPSGGDPLAGITGMTFGTGGFPFLRPPGILAPRAGHVSPEGVAFLTAAHAVLRGTLPAELERMASLLHPDQGELFVAAVEDVAARKDALARALGVA